MSSWKYACRCALCDGVPRRSLYVALIVGTILNLINQGDAFIGMAPVNWLKVMLTYCVPYAVATYGAVSYQTRQPLSGSATTESSQAPVTERGKR
ncbi:MAG TPA: nitrate/nitrite transporter NrtS [Casimicrobiaceae bacterium]|nr:nitrate/nitrite transporter NrtS [Casimicrobiaceae bacterium]